MSFSTRLLIFAGIAAVIGVAGLWLLGGKKAEYSTSVVIEATPDQVFPYLTQPDLLSEWVAGLKQVSPLIPNREDNRPSSASRTPRVVETDGKQVRFEDEIIRFTENKMVSVQSSNPSVVITSIYQLEPKTDSKTELQYRVRASSIGLGRLLAPLQKSDVQSRIEDEAQRLKLLVEKETDLKSRSESIRDVLGKNVQDVPQDQNAIYDTPLFDQSTQATVDTEQSAKSQQSSGSKTTDSGN